MSEFSHPPTHLPSNTLSFLSGIFKEAVSSLSLDTSKWYLNTPGGFAVEIEAFHILEYREEVLCPEIHGHLHE